MFHSSYSGRKASSLPFIPDSSYILCVYQVCSSLKICQTDQSYGLLQSLQKKGYLANENAKWIPPPPPLIHTPEKEVRENLVNPCKNLEMRKSALRNKISANKAITCVIHVRRDSAVM